MFFSLAKFFEGIFVVVADAADAFNVSADFYAERREILRRYAARRNANRRFPCACAL